MGTVIVTQDCGPTVVVCGHTSGGGTAHPHPPAPHEHPEYEGGGEHPDLAGHDALGLATDDDVAAAVDAHLAAVDHTHPPHPDLAEHDALGLATDAELGEAFIGHLATAPHVEHPHPPEPHSHTAGDIADVPAHPHPPEDHGHELGDLPEQLLTEPEGDARYTQPLGPCRAEDTTDGGLTVYQWFGGSGDPTVADSTIYRYRWLDGRDGDPTVDRTALAAAAWDDRATADYTTPVDHGAALGATAASEGAPLFIRLTGEPAPTTEADRYQLVTLTADGTSVVSIEWITEV